MKSLLKSPVSVLVVCGILLPPFTYAFGLTYSTASEILIYAIAGLGYTGLVSFGHGIFFGVAAYAASIIQVKLMPGYIFIPMALAVAVSTLFGVIIGYLSLRLRGVYFSLLTLSFAAMFFYIIYRWTSFTGGEDGYGPAHDDGPRLQQSTGLLLRYFYHFHGRFDPGMADRALPLRVCAGGHQGK